MNFTDNLKSFLFIAAGLFSIIYFAGDLILKILAIIIGLILIIIGFNIGSNNNSYSYRFLSFKNYFKKF